MREKVKNAKRIVIKVGTTTLTHPNGRTHFERMDKLALVLSDLKNDGKEIVLVSSGAIGVGAAKLKWEERPRSVQGKQVAAAVGQSELMHIYSKFFAEYGHIVAQILINSDVFESSILKKNVQNTFETLLKEGVIPIVNANDPIATEELEGSKSMENDHLSALVAKTIQADLLILLSDIDGFYTDNPKKNPEAKLIEEVHTLSEEIMLQGKGSSSNLGTGGMSTKLQAAQMVMNEGINMIIAQGEDPKVLYQIMHGEKVGTLFRGQK